MSTAREARQLLRAHRYGGLCTLSKKFGGHPFGSIAPYLADHDGSVLILISTLAEHTKNILHDPHIQSQGRVTVVGKAQIVTDREAAGQRYLRYFPEAETYFAMHDFSFYRIVPEAIRYIGGFGKIHWVDPENYIVVQADKFAKQEESLLAEMNTRQQSVLSKLLRQRRGIEAVNALAIGLDCDGLDIRCGEQVWRLDFPEAIASPSLDALALLETITGQG
jgi:hypothetical protein